MTVKSRVVLPFLVPRVRKSMPSFHANLQKVFLFMFSYHRIISADRNDNWRFLFSWSMQMWLSCDRPVSPTMSHLMHLHWGVSCPFTFVSTNATQLHILLIGIPDYSQYLMYKKYSHSTSSFFDQARSLQSRVFLFLDLILGCLIGHCVFNLIPRLCHWFNGH